MKYLCRMTDVLQIYFQYSINILCINQLFLGILSRRRKGGFTIPLQILSFDCLLRLVDLWYYSSYYCHAIYRSANIDITLIGIVLFCLLDCRTSGIRSYNHRINRCLRGSWITFVWKYLLPGWVGCFNYSANNIFI